MKDVWLLDVNVLLALVRPAHVHHQLVHQWFERVAHRAWATCTLTELGFIRLSCNSSVVDTALTPAQAVDALHQLRSVPQHQFWSDAPSPADMPSFNGSLIVTGHRQITDAYLLGLALQNGSKLATLDRGLMALAAKMHDQSVEWIGP